MTKPSRCGIALFVPNKQHFDYFCCKGTKKNRKSCTFAP